jgi:hypothetical protein
MKKKRFLSMVCLIFTIIFSAVQLSSAYINLDEIKEVYNLGDKLYITASILPDIVEGKFEINLVCDGKSINIERMSAEPRFAAGEEAKYSTFIKLVPENIGNLKGKCNVQVSVGSEKASTKSLIISDKILTSIKLDKLSYNPGETIILDLEAKKENGDSLEGFFNSTGIFSLSRQIKNGKLIEKLAVDKDLASGLYSVDVLVYDSIGSIKLNNAKTSFSFNVNQVPTSLNLALSESEANPGSNITINSEILDQSDKKIEGSMDLKIVSPSKEETKLNIQSGESSQFYFPFDAEYGIWKVVSSFSKLEKGIDLEIKKYPRASFSFIDNVLVVKNTGNDVYTGKIKAVIAGQNLEVNVDSLEKGKEISYIINTPEEGIVSVTDGNNKIEQKLSPTGAVIGIKEYRGAGFFSRNPFVWWFILIILILFAVSFLLKLRKTPFKLVGDLKEKLTIKRENKKAVQLGDDFSLKAKNKITKAEHTLVLKGEKQPSSIISVKIDNFNSLSGNTKQEILKIIWIAEDKKGVIEKSGDYFLIIFNPLATKSFSNEANASDNAFKIYKLFVELNSKISDKFNFGIGLNNGDLIASIGEDKLAYTSIGNSVLLAKKMSDLKQNKIYASEDFRKKLMRDLKVEKSGQIGPIQIYSVLHVANRSGNETKLDDLLKRMQSN